MPTMKPSAALQTSLGAKRFSLVPALAQKEMYKTLSTLKSSKHIARNGAEVAEIAIRATLNDGDPVIVIATSSGLRKASKKALSGKNTPKRESKVCEATVSAVAELITDPKATALICAGKLDSQAEAWEDCRRAFAFAAAHKLPILFLVGNVLIPGRRQKIDVRTLYAEFGIPVFSVAANDAIAAYRVATEALHNARHDRGPCVIEALTVDSKKVKSIGALDLLRDYMERHGNRPI